MKRIWSILILALVIAVICTTGCLYIFNFENNITKMMNESKQLIQDKQYEQAAKASKRAEQYFVKNERIISVFCDHELLEQLGVSISKLAPLAEEETEYEFDSELQSAFVMLRHLVNDQRPSIRNIL